MDEALTLYHTLIDNIANEEGSKVIFGGVVFFWLVWMWERNKANNQLPTSKFFHDQKDDMGLTALVGFGLIVWDDSFWLPTWNAITGQSVEIMPDWAYFTAGIMADLLFKAFKYYMKSKK